MNYDFSIDPIPAFKDNYLWLITNTRDQNAVVVDPGDAQPVLRYLEQHQLNLSAILITHHHWDHINGIDELLSVYDIPVYGPDSDKISQVTHPLHQDDRVQLFDKTLAFDVLEVPGHTRDHIAYFGYIDQQASLFCGDALFAAGCGRIFDGTHQQLRRSLQKLNQLPEHTRIYCTHEYTLANLAFAEAVEPDNPAIQQRIITEKLKRSQQEATLPTTLLLERQTNPFLRYKKIPVAKAINQYWNTQWQTPEELFAGLRRWKDNF